MWKQVTSPLVEPDLRISRIRLSQKRSAESAPIPYAAAALRPPAFLIKQLKKTVCSGISVWCEIACYTQFGKSRFVGQESIRVMTKKLPC